MIIGNYSYNKKELGEKMNIDKIQTEVLQDFDFVRVQLAMENSNWTWAQHDGARVPTAEELKVFALNLIKQVIKEAKETQDSVNIRSGGFSVTAFNSGVVGLEFVLEFCCVKG